MANSTIPFTIVKIGGKPAANQEVLDELIQEIVELVSKGQPLVLVHGGGADVSDLSRRLGLEPRFVDGKRVTSAEEMLVVEAVLAGNVNTRILRRFLAAGGRALGLCGVDAGLFTAVSVDPQADSRTGSITATHPQVLLDLCNLGYVPVVSSVSCDPNGAAGLNINADDAAMELAIALGASTLVYLSDIPGILKDGQVLARIDQARAEAEITAGVISGGMIPKVRSSLGAVTKGVGRVVIGGFQHRGDLQAFIAARQGTAIY